MDSNRDIVMRVHDALEYQAADPFVQQLIAENARLKDESARLESINARLQRKLTSARNSLVGLAQHIDGE